MIRDKENSLKSYLADRNKKAAVVFFMSLITVVLSFHALTKGAFSIDFWEAIWLLSGRGDDISSTVVWNIRLPRILGALIAGSGLALAGNVMQTSLRNPLASPSTLGITSAAAFGANLGILYMGGGALGHGSQAVSINNPYTVTLSAFLFSLLAMGMILLIARARGFSPESIVLAGVAFSSLFSAGTTLIQYFSQDHQVAAMVFWTFGDLGRISWNELTILFTITAVFSGYFYIRRWDFNTMDSGDNSAKSLGLDVELFRLKSMVLACLVTAASVSFMGIIGFVGLVAPQIMRRVVGSDHRMLIPASSLAGALLMLTSDTIARTIISPVVLPVGAVTSFFGAPLFLYLLIKGYSRGGSWQ